MRWWLRNHKEVNLVTRIVSHLVRCAWWNPNPFPGTQDSRPSINFHERLACEQVEKLLRVMV